MIFIWVDGIVDKVGQLFALVVEDGFGSELIIITRIENLAYRVETFTKIMDT
jgi:hypothetical protein